MYSKIASLAITSPDIRLDFEYLLSDGYNEGLMDFEINGERSALASYIEGPGGLGLNFFINYSISQFISCSRTCYVYDVELI